MLHVYRLCHAEACLRPNATANAQISLRIRAIWSGPSLSANRITGYNNVWMESKGLDDTLRMRKMIWIWTFCACSNTLFRLQRPTRKKRQWFIISLVWAFTVSLQKSLNTSRQQMRDMFLLRFVLRGLNTISEAANWFWRNKPCHQRTHWQN